MRPFPCSGSSATAHRVDPAQCPWLFAEINHRREIQSDEAGPFLAFIIQCYGSVLAPLSGGRKAYSDVSSSADQDQGNLSRALGSVVGMAALRAEGGVGPQLVSHTFGLLKARDSPNQSEEDKWLSSDEGTEWVLKTIDEILDGVGHEAVKAKL
jgi:hypothetical protein